MHASFRIKGGRSKAFISVRRIIQAHDSNTQKPSEWISLRFSYPITKIVQGICMVSTEFNQEKQTITNIYELQSIQY